MNKDQVFEEAVRRTVNDTKLNDTFDSISVKAIDEFIALCKYYGIELKDFK